MLTLSILGEQQSGDLAAPEHPGNLSSEDTDTELHDFTEPSLQFQKALNYVKNVHQLTHLGSKKLQAFLKDQKQSFPLTDSQRKEIAERVTKTCRVCQLVNAYPSKLPAGKRLRGTRPGQFWEVDFTEIKPARYGLKYLLVFVDTFSGWVEAFPTKKETAQVVVKKILEEIFPSFRWTQHLYFICMWC
ncbi:uncharacterized protein LOC124099250 isoform X2 [Marmota monax]|uniref:uncharacterized protein LOC124099250 isoform X2 n=1 Tax=Marmota monax TaxID=9995 RepID=UPI0026EA7E83|nr:uncharacterized protein LOC124099250 isoform X2 [Marmota monax]